MVLQEQGGVPPSSVRHGQFARDDRPRPRQEALPRQVADEGKIPTNTTSFATSADGVRGRTAHRNQSTGWAMQTAQTDP
jgi:hypothetical protein